MAQLLDRFRRKADGKEFAVISLGSLTKDQQGSSAGRHLTLEAEDGELIETKFSISDGYGRFERIED